jgi:SulP family sulfate permease
MLRRDVVAGLTVATVTVPQAMAYALLAGVSPVYGLYTAIVMAALGSLLGSSALLINGPTNAISLVVFGIVAGVGTGPDDPNRTGLVALLAVLAGLIQIALSLLKLAGLARHVSEAVVLGFMAGAGVLVALTQVPTVLGLKPAGAWDDHLLYRLWQTFSQGGADVRPVAISLGTVALVVGLHRLNVRFRLRAPEVLLSLVLVSALVGVLHLAPAGGQVGRLHVESCLPAPRLPVPPADWMGQLRPVGGGALAVAVVGLVEALAMARSLAVWSGQPLDYNRQCLAEGLANVGGGLFGCLPGSGSLSRSVVNYQAGAATRWSGIFSAAAVAVVLYLFAPLAHFVPEPALAGVLLWTAYRIIDPRRLWACLRSSRADAVIALATACAAVVVRVEFAVVVGALLSLLCRVLQTRTPPRWHPADSGRHGRPGREPSPHFAPVQEVVLP